ncbi:pilus assembly protein [Palleronia sp. LCG004]|uniref:TadE/TadG family type IV pilus assembly protein n=1 Tax=Palleronia sp. LCG004 TaxID=3079304 RepID=UPI0029439BEB|nr:pilus assembly protein [Palleronia sp. LCG004]WOI57054.1 pilus assembly protein [Palleronia sp. LCG004]
MRRLLQSFLGREDGTGTVEFVILFPLILWPFLITMEASFIQMRQAMLDRATDIVVRDLRLGTPELRDPETLKAALCDRILIMPDCRTDLMLAMEPQVIGDFAPPDGRVRCVDRTEEIAPATNFQVGGTNEMMMLRFCVLHDPILPNIGLGKILPREPGGGFALVSATFFVVEPTE